METSNNSIMNFTLENLISTSKSFLLKFDDYQQMASNDEISQYFADSYNQLETIVFNLDSQNVSDEVRNQIRSIIKDTEKMAAVEFYN